LSREGVVLPGEACSNRTRRGEMAAVAPIHQRAVAETVVDAAAATPPPTIEEGGGIVM